MVAKTARRFRDTKNARTIAPIPLPSGNSSTRLQAHSSPSLSTKMDFLMFRKIDRNIRDLETHCALHWSSSKWKASSESGIHNTKERLCGVKTGEFDQSSFLWCRILESILSPWKRSLRDDFLGCSCMHLCSKLRWVIEVKFRQLYDLGRTHRVTLMFLLRFHHSYASYRPI